MNCFMNDYSYGKMAGKKEIVTQYQEMLSVDHIIYNDPATIVFWKDGSKTIVKCSEGEVFNKYHGFCAALAKHIYGTNAAVTRIVEHGYDQKNAENNADEMNETDSAESNG